MSQNANTTQNSFLQFFRVTIPAGTSVKKNVTGRFLIVTDCDGNEGLPFDVALDEGSSFPMNTGLKVELPSPDSFSKVTITNPLEDAITVEFYTGSILVEDLRLNIIRGRSAPVMQAESVCTSASTTIAAGATLDLTDETTFPPPHPKYLRRATIITNMDAGSDLDIYNADNQLLTSVFFRTVLNWESSDPVKIKNNTGADIIVRVAQSWYVIQ